MLQRAIDRFSDRLVYVAPVFVAPGETLASTVLEGPVVNDGIGSRVIFRTFDPQTSENLGWRNGDQLIFVVETRKGAPVC